MTKKDYILVAKVLGNEIKELLIAQSSIEGVDYTEAYNEAVYIAEELARVFQEQNPRFNREKFLSACGIIQ